MIYGFSKGNNVISQQAIKTYLTLLLYFFFFSFYTGVQLINNVVVVAGGQGTQPHTYMHPFSLNSPPIETATPFVSEVILFKSSVLNSYEFRRKRNQGEGYGVRVETPGFGKFPQRRTLSIPTALKDRGQFSELHLFINESLLSQGLAKGEI